MEKFVNPNPKFRIGVDPGGTFTDVVVEQNGQRTTAKVLTTAHAPEEGVLEGIDTVLAAIDQLGLQSRASD